MPDLVLRHPRRQPRRRPVTPRAYVAVALLLASCAGEPPDRARPAVPPPRIAALDAEGLPALVRGRVLLGELGCVACHDGGQLDIDPAIGPDLRTAGARIDARYLHDYLTSPNTVAPGTVMPDLLRRWQGAELQERVDALVHFVRSLSPTEAIADGPPDASAALRGFALFARIGCRACHDEQRPLQLGDKYSSASLQAFLLAPHEARPSRRMPDFGLSPSEAYDLAQYLRGPGATPRAAAAQLDANKAERGRALFAELRCASCHDVGGAAAPAPTTPPPLAALDASRGCLSGNVGPWPHYELTPAQRADVRLALAKHAAKDAPAPTDEQRIQQALAQRRCFACHKRGDVDATSARAKELFGTDDVALGDEGRLPPALNDVGAKLQRVWLGRAIAHGQRERPYMHTRMPGFGEAFAESLADLLAATDTLPPIEIVPLPAAQKAFKPVLDLGQELVGDTGMSCITCHLFAGDKAGTMGAIDLVHTTGERLRPEWFAHFLRNPYRFKPATFMTNFFPGGVSTRPQLADGDVQRQVDAIWHYLAQGRNVRKPSGIKQPPIELTVGDEAVMLRRFVQGAGKRGISIGLPGGVNATFDAENLGLNQLWWGRFLDAQPVWTSQGHGQARILSREVFQLPNGPAFAALDAPDSPWPTASRRERGDRWLGYELDTARRPTFGYTAGEVTIHDALREVTGEDGRIRLSRTITVSGDKAVLYLRAATHDELRMIDANTAAVGTALRVRCDGAPMSIVTTEGQPQRELRMRITIDVDPALLTIEYSREPEDGK